MTFHDWTKNKVDLLREAGIDYPEDELRVILTELFSKKRATMIFDPLLDIHSIFTNNDLIRIDEVIAGRIKRLPLGYLLGEQFFYRDTFSVGPGVLVPRFDSEILVGAALFVLGIDDSFLGAKYESLEQLKIKSNEDVIHIMDVCTGSGCIGISIANVLSNYLVDYKMLITEISDMAAVYAKENISRAVEPERINLIMCDLFPPQHDFEDMETKCQLIVANPPYITDDEMKTLMPEVADHEPKEALMGGRDGLHFYKRILSEMSFYLAPQGILAVEHGYLQSKEVEALFLDYGFTDVACLKDYGDNDRVTIGRLKSNGETA